MIASLTPSGWSSALTDGGTYNVVWGLAPNNVWVGGRTLRRYDGNAWNAVPHPPLGSNDYIRAISGTAPDDVWFAGGGGQGSGFFWHWDGQTVSAIATTPQQINALSAFSRTRAFAAGFDGIYRWDGASWALVHPTREWAWSIYARPNGEVWAGGFNGFLISSSDDGGTWRGGVADFDEAKALFATSPADRFAVGGNGTVLKWREDAGWTQLAKLQNQDGGSARLWGGWGLAADDLWIAAATSVYRFTGGTWTEMPLAAGTTVRAISGTSNTDVWAAGSAMLHWDGLSWTSHPTGNGNPAVAVKAFAPGTVFAATSVGLVGWDGGAFGQLGPPSGDVLAMYAASPSDIWLGGNYGQMWHFDGGTTVRTRPLNFQAERIQSISGSSASDIWAGGYNFLLHYDGGSWTSLPAAQAYFDHSSLIVASPTDVMASTWRNSVIFRYRP